MGDDLEEEMKTNELLKKGGKEAIDLIDELKNYQNGNLEMLKRLKENLINLRKATPATRPIQKSDLAIQAITQPIQKSDLATQTITPPTPATRPIQKSDLATQTIAPPTPATRPIQKSDLATQTITPPTRPKQFKYLSSRIGPPPPPPPPVRTISPPPTDEYVEVDLLEKLNNAIAQILSIKNKISHDYAFENVKGVKITPHEEPYLMSTLLGGRGGGRLCYY